MQLGVRQTRYFGRTKTLFQLLMAATVANLTLVATKTGLMRDHNHTKTVISIHVCALLAALSFDPRLRNHIRSRVFGHTSRGGRKLIRGEALDYTGCGQEVSGRATLPAVSNCVSPNGIHSGI
jgi:hypothetical protein